MILFAIILFILNMIWNFILITIYSKVIIDIVMEEVHYQLDGERP